MTKQMWNQYIFKRLELKKEEDEVQNTENCPKLFSKLFKIGSNWDSKKPQKTKISLLHNLWIADNNHTNVFSN